jgi:hypothetical protein
MSWLLLNTTEVHIVCAVVLCNLMRQQRESKGAPAQVDVKELDSRTTMQQV